MRNLFALLVAIDQYHQPEIRDLQGTLNDVAEMELALTSYCGQGGNLQLHKRVLKNKKATRRAVIEAFQFFNEAQNQDVCLFYFSGHGGKLDAPKEFWHEADQQLEALVCHQEKGNDNLLIDKELSYLIAEVQKEKELHFVVITDSCHSGSNTKDLAFTARSVSPNLNTRSVADYWGRAAYRESKNAAGELIRLQPPVGKHVKLSACLSSEVAKEKALGDDGKMRGVFTHALLEVLRESGYNLSYTNLLRKVRVKTQLKVTDQSPQLETIALLPQECNCTFLQGLLVGQKPRFQIRYEETQGKWLINVGRLYGVQEQDLAILDDGPEVAIKKVYINHAILDREPLNSYQRDKVYDATIRSITRKQLNLAFAPGSSETTKNRLLALLNETGTTTLCFNAAKDIDYVVHAQDTLLALTPPEGNIPVFSRIQVQAQDDIRLFLKLLEQVADWHHLITITNPQPDLRDTDVCIELRSVENPHRQQNADLAPSTLLTEWQAENVFHYNFDETTPGGPWYPPAFRLSITNRSATQKLWVSALYCGSGYIFEQTTYTSTLFSITNRFLEKTVLDKEQVATMVDIVSDPTTNRQAEYQTIELTVLDDYFDQGYNEIKDIIKIFVSTEELDTSPFNSEGIPIDTQGVLASKHLMPEEIPATWRTFEIPITIVRPRDQGPLQVGKEKSCYGLTIIGHPAFSAHLILSTFADLIRSTQINRQDAPDEAGQRCYWTMSRPEISLGNEKVRLVTLTHGLGAVEGASVLEFYRANGVEFINEQQPLCIRLDARQIPLEPTRKLLLVGYSAVERAYVTLGTMNAQHEIVVNALPAPSPALVNGLGNSIKVFLLSVDPALAIAPYPRPAG